MTRYDDEEEEVTPKRRLRLMHFTLVMLGLLLVSKVSAVMTGVHDLVAVRDATASSAAASEGEGEHGEAEGAAAAKEEPATANRTKAQEAEIAEKGIEAKAAAEAAKKAEEEKKAKEEAGSEEGHGKEDAKKEEGGHGADDKEAPKEEMTQGEGKLSIKEIEALKAKGGAPVAYTQTEIDLLQNLAKRRDDLEAREAELDLKAKVLEATEKRINDKVSEMKTLQTDLTSIIAQYKQQQDSEVKSLVKIYESMKPLDAAAIFNELDMPILLEVIDKMSERKVAPILAGMNPKRARDVTQELAEMRRGRSVTANAAAAAAATP